MQAKAPVRAHGPGLAPAVRTPAAAPSWQRRRPGAAQQLCAAPKPAGSSSDGAAEQPSPAIDYPDPQAKFFRYGRFFGGGYKLDADWLKDVPQVRVRNSETRKMDEILELAVLNERLAGTMTPWEARRKLEYLKMRRRNWERVYAYITEQEVTASLELIEEAYAKVEEALSAEAKERSSIGQLNARLLDLQSSIAEAEQKLAVTRTRVDQNLQKVTALKQEADALERARRASSGEGASTRSGSGAAAAPAPELTNVAAVQRRNRGLKSSLEIEEQLKNFWYPVEFVAKLTPNTMVPFELFNQPWVLFRDEAGNPACIRDTCAHRACPLSLGKVDNGQVVCAYHGWKFDGSGQCTKMPSTAFCKNVSVAALPCVEKDGFVWIWPGEAEPTGVPDYTRPPEGFEIHAEIMVDVPVEHGLLMENLLDLAHAPFTHVSTFARGWPVPDAVKFHATKLLSGNWDPYPINMAFQPPCMVLSMIGLAQPGKIMRGVTAEQCDRHLHQLHICMPSKKGHTRLLYRMSLDFMQWIKYVPWIDRVWKAVAGQVLGEDLVLVLGQQDRLQRGGDTWNFPVSYDKIAVRYRRWRNALAAGNASEAAALASAASNVSAGELFSLDEGDHAEQGEAGTQGGDDKAAAAAAVVATTELQQQHVSSRA